VRERRLLRTETTCNNISREGYFEVKKVCTNNYDERIVTIQTFLLKRIRFIAKL
jgi:hypothetical protein